MQKVTIFGAGASREYQWFENVGPFPLDGDFLADMRAAWTEWRHPDLPTPRHQDYDGAEWDWPALEQQILSVTGAASIEDVGFEEAFGAIARESRHWEDRFCRGIELVLFWKLRGTGLDSLPVHTEYLRRAVNPGDSLITFNYDPLVELALLGLEGSTGLNWHPGDGYGLTFDGELVADEGIRPIELPAASNIEVLKLHGSLNWLVPVERWPSRPSVLLRLLRESMRGPGHILVRDGDQVYRPVFVPPQPVKDYEAFGLTPLWGQARQAILQADTLTIIGYSFPETDEAARDLVIGAANESATLERVVLVTPDANAANRLQSALRTAEVIPLRFREYVDQLPPAVATG